MSLNKKYMKQNSPVFCLQYHLTVLHETVLWGTQPLGQQGSYRNKPLKEKVGQLMKVREDLVPQLRELIILRCHALDFPSLSPTPVRISIRYHNSCDKTRHLTTTWGKGLFHLTLPHHNP